MCVGKVVVALEAASANVFWPKKLLLFALPLFTISSLFILRALGYICNSEQTGNGGGGGGGGGGFL